MTSLESLETVHTAEQFDQFLRDIGKQQGWRLFGSGGPVQQIGREIDSLIASEERKNSLERIQAISRNLIRLAAEPELSLPLADTLHDVIRMARQKRAVLLSPEPSAGEWALANTLYQMGSSLLRFNRAPLSETKEEDQYTVAHLSSWHGFRLVSGNIRHFIRYLKERHGQRIDFIEEALFNNETIENRTPSYLVVRRFQEYAHERPFYTKKELLALPFVFPRHIVAILIDFPQKTVEYYDPRGRPPDAYGYPGFSMRKDLEEVRRLCFKEGSLLKVNPFCQQNDYHNCGVFVSYYMERRALGKSHEEIVAEEWNSAMAESYRDEMARKLSPDCP